MTGIASVYQLPSTPGTFIKTNCKQEGSYFIFSGKVFC